MNRWLRLAVWLAATAGWVAVYFAADHLFSWVQPNYQAAPDALTVGLTLVWFGAVLLFRARWGAWAAALFFATAQWAQFLHYRYFGAPIAPHEPPLLFSEWREIIGAFAGVSHFFGSALLLPIVPLVAFAVAYSTNRHWGWQARGWPLLLFLGLLVILPVKAYRSPAISQAFYPHPYGYALKNSWLVTAYAIGASMAQRGVAAQPPITNREPYEVDRRHDGVDGVIVLVMGESTNPAMMSLFGGSEPTTPFLASLRDNPDAIVTVGRSAGVATKVTLPMFFNVLREPWRQDVVMSGKSALITLAKANGYRVVVESAQTSNLFTYTRAELADLFCTVDRCGAKSDGDGVDRLLLERIAQEPLTQKTLLVLHTRVAHSMYDQFTPRNWRPFSVDEGSFEGKMKSTYRNAIAWFDEVVRQIVSAVIAKSSRPVWVIITGDHNELLGEGGRWGHGQLAEQAGLVPVVVLTANGAKLPDGWRERLRCAPSHYELGQLVAELLGWLVRSPEEDPNVLFTNGPDLNGRAGWLRYDRVWDAKGCQLREELVQGSAKR
jgi:glucan phosphoethanolaminetransferase (alkaline phosphatase superfamily)